MRFDQSQNEILKSIEANDLLGGFSLLMNYAHKNNAHDRVMSDIVKLIAEADLDSMTNENVKNCVVDLLNRIQEDVSDGEAVDASVVNLSRRNFLVQTKPPVFSCRNVNKKLGFFRLNDISLDLRVGEITAVVGENSNGKTTLCRIVGALIAIDDGHIAYPYFPQVNSQNLNWEVIKNNIAYLSQEISPISGTVKNILHLEASLRGIRGEENRQRVDFIIRRLGLTEYIGAQWNELSGEFKLRLSLARILLWRPNLIILDEPLANLDLKAQITVLSDLRDYADSISYPMSILITSQHIHEVEFIADKIIFLQRGNTIYCDEIGKIGEGREYNNFEIDCKCSLKQLQMALSKLSTNRLISNGLYFELETPVEVTSGSILAALNDAGIDVLLFRDISYSTKKLLFANV